MEMTETGRITAFQAAPSPYGTLSILPREIRDKIYEEVVSKRYAILGHPGSRASLVKSDHTHLLVTLSQSVVMRRRFCTPKACSP